MAKIVHSVKVWDIVGATLDHPKMTQRERDMKEAQRRILALFGDMLLESWPTKDGPQFMDCVVVQD
jgi:hypothetical protein